MIVTDNELLCVTLVRARAVGVLANAAGDIDQLAFLNLGGTLNQLAEQRHLVMGRDLADLAMIRNSAMFCMLLSFR